MIAIGLLILLTIGFVVMLVPRWGMRLLFDVAVFICLVFVLANLSGYVR